MIMFPTRVHSFRLIYLVLALVIPATPIAAAEVLPFLVEPGTYPEPSSVQTTIKGNLLVGSDDDDSSLSGDGEVVLGIAGAPFDTALITEISVVLVDGMDFRLAGGLVTAKAEPGATRVILIDAPDEPATVVNGKFDQIGNLFAFEGIVTLSTQEEPLDLSTLAPVEADLLGIELIDLGSEIESKLSFDLHFETTIPIGGDISIDIKGGIRSFAQKLIPGDLNGNSILDAGDIDLLSEAVRIGSGDPKFDLNNDQLVNGDDRQYWVKQLAWTYFGDADLNGEFNSSDFVQVFQAGEYEDQIAGNSTWATGDWDGNAEFNSSDFVTAFQDGGYEQGPMVRPQAIPEPSTAILFLAGAIICACRRQRSP